MTQVFKGGTPTGASKDEIAEWRAWIAKNKFTVETAWNEAPPGFQRRFEAIWGELTGVNQSAAETEFFLDWSLMRLVSRGEHAIMLANETIRNLATDLKRRRSGHTRNGMSRANKVAAISWPISTLERIRFTQFELFAGRRAVVLPPLLTKQVADAVLKRLRSELLAKVPKHYDLIGTDAAWRVYLAAESLKPPGKDSISSAMGDFFRARSAPLICKRLALSASEAARWFDHGVLKPLPLNAARPEKVKHQQVSRLLNAEATRDRQSNRQFDRWVTFLDQLSMATFPWLNTKVLQEPTPSRVRGSKPAKTSP